MKHATRASGLVSKAFRNLAQATHGILMLSAFAAIVLLGGHYVRGQAAESDAALLAAAEAETVLQEEPQLSAEMQRVRDWVARRYRVSGDALETAFVEAELSAREAELDPLLIVAMIAVESSFNPEAKSHAGALGLMQVIPRWHMDKIGPENDYTALFDPRFNVQVGTLVLVEGLQRYGTLEAALQYYNGARDDPEMRYTKRVMSVKRQLQDVLRKSSGA
ncbi:MAG: transglycosylase SLT domain-containing protein [Zoogloeaceae bacterium]|nr:transglycosylase SLT domain-containing protein [Zoogloeaceae bacterium]